MSRGMRSPSAHHHHCLCLITTSQTRPSSRVHCKTKMRDVWVTAGHEYVCVYKQAPRSARAQPHHGTPWYGRNFVSTVTVRHARCRLSYVGGHAFAYRLQRVQDRSIPAGMAVVYRATRGFPFFVAFAVLAPCVHCTDSLLILVAAKLAVSLTKGAC